MSENQYQKIQDSYKAPAHTQGGAKHPYAKPILPEFKDVTVDEFLSDPADDELGRYHSGSAEQVRAEALKFAKANPGTDEAKSAKLFAATIEVLFQDKHAAPENAAVDLATQPARFIDRFPYPLPAQDANGNSTGVAGWAWSASTKPEDKLSILRDMLSRDIRNNIASKTRVAGS